MINAAAFNSAVNLVEEFNSSSSVFPLDAKAVVTNIVFNEIAEAVETEYLEYLKRF